MSVWQRVPAELLCTFVVSPCDVIGQLTSSSPCSLYSFVPAPFRPCITGCNAQNINDFPTIRFDSSKCKTSMSYLLLQKPDMERYLRRRLCWQVADGVTGRHWDSSAMSSTSFHDNSSGKAEEQNYHQRNDGDWMEFNLAALPDRFANENRPGTYQAI